MMTLQDALKVVDHAYATDGPVSHAAILIAAEVRRLQSENASLRLYSPAQRAQPTIKTEPIGRTNFAFYGIETDEEFAAKVRAYMEVEE